ncbi:MAG: ABC transporter permease, partial [Pseudomonadales bacterium]|nr:ABC transporter permease [Pseudomonadales bacterium]
MNYWFEFKYTLRLMRKKFGFTILCTSVIAMGIGIIVPLIFMAKVVGLAGLPYENGDRFVIIREGVDSLVNQRIDAFTYQRLEQSVTSYESFGAYREMPAVFSDGDTAELYNAARLTPDVLAITNVPPLLGRSLQPEDDSISAAPVVVISYDLWQNYYAGTTNILDLQARINGEFYSIVGVMPEEFSYPIQNDLWLPLQMESNAEPGESPRVTPIALLRETASIDAAILELNSLLQSLNAEFPDTYGDRVGYVRPFSQLFTTAIRYVPLIIGLSLSMLLLVCLNVGTLLIVRSNERIAELAVRTAVGGTRYRAIRQVLMESFLICMMGALVGLLIGVLSLNIIENWFASSNFELPFWLSFGLQKWEIASIFLATLAVWAVSGFYPAWAATRQDICGVLGNDSKTTANIGTSKLTRLLVSTEVVMSCFLLIVCWVFVVFVYRANQVDFGVNPDGFLTASVDFSSADYSGTAEKLNFLDNLVIEVSNDDAFESMAYATTLAGNYPERIRYRLEDQDIAAGDRIPDIGSVWIGADYLSSMDTELIAGRYFNNADNAFSSPVTIVDQLFAETYWPNESAIGKQIQLHPEGESETVTVTGVVNQLIYGEPDREALNGSAIYRPLAQLPLTNPEAQLAVNSVAIVVKTPMLNTISIANFERSLKVIASEVDRNIPINDVKPLSY